MGSGVSGLSGVPAADRVDLGPSIDSGHVTTLCQVMAGSGALGTMYNHSPVMCIPARGGVKKTKKPRLKAPPPPPLLINPPGYRPIYLETKRIHPVISPSGF